MWWAGHLAAIRQSTMEARACQHGLVAQRPARRPLLLSPVRQGFWLDGFIQCLGPRVHHQGVVCVLLVLPHLCAQAPESEQAWPAVSTSCLCRPLAAAQTFCLPPQRQQQAAPDFGDRCVYSSWFFGISVNSAPKLEIKQKSSACT